MKLRTVKIKDHFAAYKSAAGTMLPVGCSVHPIKKLPYNLHSKIDCLSLIQAEKKLTHEWMIDGAHVFTGYVIQDFLSANKPNLYKLPTFSGFNKGNESGITHLDDMGIAGLLTEPAKGSGLVLLETLRTEMFYLTWQTILYSGMLYVRFPTLINGYWGFGIPNEQSLDITI